MAETSKGGLKTSSGVDMLISIQDVLQSFNNSIGEEQAWAVCYQCAQFFLANSSQEKFRDIYYYGLEAIKLSKDGDLIIDGSFNQGSGKGPPKSRSSLGLSQEFKSILTPIDVTQAIGTAIYKALDFGLPESEEPHLSGELEELIESLLDHPTDDDEGIDIERDSDDSQGKEQSVFQDIIECCEGHLTGQQNAQVHYKAVCRALATEAKELLTFLDVIASGQKKLAQVRRENANQGLDDLAPSDWARLWVQIMGELRHGVRLKKVEQVHLPPVEFELTPFEILLEDIRTRRYNLNRIMVNGDIPQKVKSDAHAVILDFIRSRPPLKPANRRQLKSAPVRQMDPREKLMAEIVKPHKLRAVRRGKLVVGARRSLLDSCEEGYNSSDEERSKSSRKVIKPVAAFQVKGPGGVSTDDSDSYFSDSEDDDRRHVEGPDMSPLSPVDPDNWKITVTKDMVTTPTNCSNLTRRHTISGCDVKNGKKVHKHSHHSPVMEEEEEENISLHDDSFVRGHASRRPTKMVAYRHSHGDSVHDRNVVTVSDENYEDVRNSPSDIVHGRSVVNFSGDLDDLRPKSPMKHAGHFVMSKSHGNLVDHVSVPAHHSHLHDPCVRKLSSSHRSHSLASIVQPVRSSSPIHHVVRSVSPNCRRMAGRPESPVRHLSRSETFTYSTPTKSRTCARNEIYIAARSDSPQSRQMVRSDSFPSARCESPHTCQRAESPRRHSIQVMHAPQDPSMTRSRSEVSRRHSIQHAPVDSTGSRSTSHSSRRHSNVHVHDQRHSAHEQPVRSSSPVSHVLRARGVQRHASSACENQGRHEYRVEHQGQVKREYREASRTQHAATEHSTLSHRSYGNRDNSPSPINDDNVSNTDGVDPSTQSSTSALQARRIVSFSKQDSDAASGDSKQGQRSRPSIIRARSKPDMKTSRSIIKTEEDKHFAFIERTKPVSGSSSEGNTADGEFKRPATSRVPRPIVGRTGADKNREPSNKISCDVDGEQTVQNGQQEVNIEEAKIRSRLSRQSAIRTGRTDVRQKLASKSVSFDSEASDTPQRESRTRRVGVVSHENPKSEQASETVRENNTASRSTQPRQEVTSSKSSTERQEVTSRRNPVRTVQVQSPKDSTISKSDESSTQKPGLERHVFKQVRPIIRSRSEVRPRSEVKPVKVSHDLHLDLDPVVNSNSAKLDSVTVVPEISEPDLLSSESIDLLDHDVPDVIKTSRSEFKVKDLLHVSWRTDCPDQDTNRAHSPSSSDLQPLPHKWNNPIECLSLTLEEISHIRSVLTKAELESLVTNRDLYIQISKGKTCFTCKKTKFSLFGQWGTKCKFCQRTVCNYCLRKMNVPTEHFEKIPVYTLSPVPISPDIMEKLKVYESTGSVPHSPISKRKQSSPEKPSPKEEPAVSITSADDSSLAAKRRTLQRSHTIGVGSRPPPNRALLKGPQMSICCDCKSMIMEIIRASRTSVSVVTGGQPGPGEPRRSVTPTEVSQDHPVLREKSAEGGRDRPRSMLANFNFKSFNFTKTDTSEA